MKILQVCKKFPYPLKDGESVANTYISKALHDLGCEVTLLAMNTTKHYLEVDEYRHELAHYKAIHAVKVDNTVNYFDALWHLMRNKSYNIARFVSNSFEDVLIQLLKNQQFDVIQLETSYLNAYIPVIRKYSKALIAMRAHNVEYEIWERLAKNTPIGLKKWYFKHISKKLREFEKQYLEQYDLLVTFTDRDLSTYRKMGYYNGATLSPIGLNLGQYVQQDVSRSNGPKFAFIGALDWLPNLEGLSWLVDKVWPHILAKYPHAELHIAGRKTPSEVFSLAKDSIIIHGEVQDSKIFLNQFPIILVPLFSGSGMRVKILEAMALGRIVIATSVAVEGIPVTDGVEFFLADDPDQFLKAIGIYVDKPHAVNKMQAAARSMVHNYYDNMRLAEKLLDTYRKEIPKYQKKALIK